MHRVPDHSPAAAAAAHAALIVALDAGDLAGRERDAAATLASSCAGCASLLADLVALRAATAALQVAPRTRDYRLTDADAARLRPSTWRSLVRWLAAPRSSVRPLAGGLATLGVAGLLLTTAPGFFGGAATSLTTGAPAVAPRAADGAAGAAAGSSLPSAVAGSTAPAPSAAPSTAPSALTIAPVGPNAAAPVVGPITSGAAAPSPALGVPGVTPGLAAVPPPSPLAVALPAPSPASGAGTITGPADGPIASADSSGFSANSAAATDSTTKVAPPEAAQGGRTAIPPVPAQPAPQDRSVPILLSLALLAAGLGLFVVNRALRGRA